MTAYTTKKDKEKYQKTWIKAKTVKNINSNPDKRFYLFKKVLSQASVLKCCSKMPGNNKMYTIQKAGGRRRYAQDGHDPLQDCLRNEYINFRKNETRAIEQGQQKMKVSDFYLLIASKLGIEDPHLCDKDKLILHEPQLQVFRNDYHYLPLK